MNENENVDAQADQPIQPYPKFTGSSERGTVDLPVGSFGIDGKYYRKVEFKPLTGATRKKIGRPDILNNPGKLVTTVLTELLEFPHIGFEKADAKGEKKLMVRSMFSADRSACVFAIRAATTNLPMVQSSNCPLCGARLEISTKPEEVEMWKIEDTEYKMNEEDAEFYFDYEATFGPHVRFVLSRGFQEEQFQSDVMRNIGEFSHQILARTIKSYDDKVVEPEMFDDMLSGKIDELFDVFTGNSPGPETLLSVECSTCNGTFDIGVDPSDFLLPNVRRRRSRRHSKK